MAPGVIFESNESDNCMASSTTVQIVGASVAPGLPTGLGQFKADGTTDLPVGAWTNQTTVVLRFTMTDASPTDSLVPEVEIKPVTTAFTGIGLRAGSPVASTGGPVQGSVTVTGLSDGLSVPLASPGEGCRRPGQRLGELRRQCRDERGRGRRHRGAVRLGPDR